MGIEAIKNSLPNRRTGIYLYRGFTPLSGLFLIPLPFKVSVQIVDYLTLLFVPSSWLSARFATRTA